MAEWQLFEPGTAPEWTTPEWYADREHAPHLEQSGHRERLHRTASLVAGLAAGHGWSSVVDLGAGDGGLLSLLGPRLRRWGYDLSPANIVAAHERGVDVSYLDVVADMVWWADIAVATEMLEHLVNPHAYVRHIREHTQALVCSSPWTETCDDHYEHHTWAWDLAGYPAMLRDAGWHVVRHETVGAFQLITALAVAP